MTTKRFFFMLLVMLMSVTGAWADIIHHAQTDPTTSTVGYKCECWENTSTGKFYTDSECTNEIDPSICVTYLKFSINPVFGEQTFTEVGDIELDGCRFDWAAQTEITSHNDNAAHYIDFVALGKDVANARIKWHRNDGCIHPSYGTVNVKVYVNGQQIYSTSGTGDELKGLHTIPLPNLKEIDKVRFEVQKPERAEWSYGNPLPAFTACLEFTSSGLPTVMPITLAVDDKMKFTGVQDPAFSYKITRGALRPGESLSDLIFSREEGETAGNYTVNISQPEGANPGYNINCVPGKLEIREAIYHAQGTATLTSRGYSRDCWEETATGKWYADDYAETEINPVDVFLYAKLDANPIIEVSTSNVETFEERRVGSDGDGYKTLYYGAIAKYADHLASGQRYAKFRVNNYTSDARVIWYTSFGDREYGSFTINVFVNDVVKYSIDQSDGKNIGGFHHVPLGDLSSGDIVKFEVHKQVSRWGGAPELFASLEYVKDLWSDMEVELREFAEGFFGSTFTSQVQDYILAANAEINAASTEEAATTALQNAKDGINAKVESHEHEYSCEAVDDTHHHDICANSDGFCTQLISADEEHVYDKTSLDDNEAYNCSVCGFLDEEVKAQYAARDYMSFTAVGGDVTIGAKVHEEDQPSYTIQYSPDRTHWTNYAVVDNGSIVTITDGETCYFRTASPTVQRTVMDVEYKDYGRTPVLKKSWNFTMTGTGTIKAEGNIMSLLDQNCQSLTVGDYSFWNLFGDCTKLTVAPKLPATTLGQSCYEYMFYGCTQLQKAPYLPAQQLKNMCYWHMFEECSSLNYAEADFTENLPYYRGNTLTNTFFHDNTEDWLRNTAAKGNLVLKREMVWAIGNYDVNLPTGWRKALKIKANEDPDNRGKFYTTYYDNNEFLINDDFKAYTGNIVRGEDGDELHLTQLTDGVIPYNTGVVICSNTPDVILATNVTTVYPVEGNALTGSTTDTTAPDNCYILSYGQNGLSFYKYAAGKTLSAHKAYLIYNSSAPANGLRMVFEDDEVDGIETPLPTSPEGEELVTIYNLQGIRLNKLQKGINIVNGKKIIVK